MYETLFGMDSRPFSPAPVVDAFFPSAAAQAARNEIGRCLERAEGPALLIGGPGLGKSLMCRVLADDLRNRLDAIVVNSAGLCTRRALLQSILVGLRLEFGGLDEGDLRMALVDHLERPSGMVRPLALLVDESHALPQRLLEELRLLSNVIYQGEPRIRIALVGSQRIEERLAHPKLESFLQRVALRSFLHPFSRQETAMYLRREVERCGGRFDRAFAENAIDAIHKATDGIPRLINQVCDHALVLQAVTSDEPVDARAIEESWADLQRLPAPWHQSRPDAVSAVEFGELATEPRVAFAVPERETPASVANASIVPERLAEAAVEFDAISQVDSTPQAEFVFTAADILSGVGFVEEEPVADRFRAALSEPRESAKRSLDSVDVDIAALATDETSHAEISFGTAIPEREGSLAIWTKAPTEAVEVDVDEAPDVRPYASVAKFDPAQDPVFPEVEGATRRVDEVSVVAAEKAPTEESLDAIPSLRMPRSPRFRRLFSTVLKG